MSQALNRRGSAVAHRQEFRPRLKKIIRSFVTEAAARRRDPMLVLIDAFWKAAEVERKTRRRVRDLEKRLPPDVTRKPRVIIGKVFGTLGEPDRPKYGHSEHDIQYKLRSDLHLFLKGFGMRKRTGAEKRALRAQFKARGQKQMAELAADRAQLEASQKKAGLFQAREACQRARDNCIELRYAIANQIVPETLEGIAAALHFVARYYRSFYNQTLEGLGDCYTASLTKRLAVEIERLSRTRSLAA